MSDEEERAEVGQTRPHCLALVVESAVDTFHACERHKALVRAAKAALVSDGASPADAHHQIERAIAQAIERAKNGGSQ